jgi:uncharacterized damage-inducible protein DinB
VEVNVDSAASPSLPSLLQSFLFRELRSLRRELERYPDEASVWITPKGLPNSAGTLALHVAGNLQHYIGAQLGQSGYVRDRPREFAARNVPRSQLMAEIDAAEEAIRTTLPSLTPEQLAADYPEQVGGIRLRTDAYLLHLVAHLAYHLGQIDYHRRVVTGDRTSVGAIAIADLDFARPTGS